MNSIYTYHKLRNLENGDGAELREQLILAGLGV